MLLVATAHFGFWGLLTNLPSNSLWVVASLHFAAQVTSAWAGNGYRVAPFEIKLMPEMDILSTEGWLSQKEFL